MDFKNYYKGYVSKRAKRFHHFFFPFCHPPPHSTANTHTNSKQIRPEEKNLRKVQDYKWVAVKMMQSSKIKHGYTEQHRKHFACVTPSLVRTSSALGGLSWEVVHYKRRRRTGEHQQTSSLWMFLCMTMEVPHSLHWHWSQLKEQLRTNPLLASTPRGWSCLYGDTWLLGPEGHLISGIRYHSTLLYLRLELVALFPFLALCHIFVSSSGQPPLPKALSPWSHIILWLPLWGCYSSVF